MTTVCNPGLVRWREDPEVKDHVFSILQLFHLFPLLDFHFCFLVKLFVILAHECGT